MDNKIKKYVCLVLALTLLLGLSASAFAMEVAQAGGCTEHNWDEPEEYLLEGKGIDSSKNGCISFYETVQVCKNCGYEKLVDSRSEPCGHVETVYDSSCNGSLQIWRLRCRSCGYRWSEQHSCPNAPHMGRPCNILPCSIGLETE